MSVPTGTPDIAGVFLAYNQAVWPAQVGLVALAFAVLGLSLRASVGSRRFMYAGLAALWAWCSLVFALEFMAPVMPVAFAFGFAYLLQAAAFTAMVVRAGQAPPGPRPRSRAPLAWVMIVYALLLYPLIGSALGHGYPAGPTFGAPCPLTIFTFGVLLLAAERTPGWLLAIPLAWSIVGSFAVVRWGVLEDIALPIAGIAGATLLILENRAARQPAAAGSVGETPALHAGIRRLH